MSRSKASGTAAIAVEGGHSSPGGATRPQRPAGCVLLGHRIRFRSQENTMTWACERCGGHTGSKTYASAAAAGRYARAFDHRDSQNTGRRAPYLGMFPLRLWRFLHDRKDRA